MARQKRDLQHRMRDVLAQSLPTERAEHVATILFMLIEGATMLAHLGQGKATIVSARRAAADVLSSESPPP